MAARGQPENEAPALRITIQFNINVVVAFTSPMPLSLNFWKNVVVLHWHAVRIICHGVCNEKFNFCIIWNHLRTHEGKQICTTMAEGKWKCTKTEAQRLENYAKINRDKKKSWIKSLHTEAEKVAEIIKSEQKRKFQHGAKLNIKIGNASY